MDKNVTLRHGWAYDLMASLRAEVNPMTATIAENVYNPKRYRLSSVARRNLHWMYCVEKEFHGKVAQAARTIGISRVWLSQLYNRWQRAHRDPRSLEPASKAPHDTSNRACISKETEQAIVEVRTECGLGKDKLVRMLKTERQIEVGATTVNRYLHKHHLIDPKLSGKNKQAWMKRKDKSSPTEVRERPPSFLRDAAPGSLVEKDMKLVWKAKIRVNPAKPRARDNFYYQHTMADAVVKYRVTRLSLKANAAMAAIAVKEDIKQFPFPVACCNSDNGGENEKEFTKTLRELGIVHFWSRPGTPTDNPRVERVHLADDQEFYARGNQFLSFAELTKRLRLRDHFWNTRRPHQALGYLTPEQFLRLWQTDRPRARAIQRLWRRYLRKQSLRLRAARKVKKAAELIALQQHLIVCLGSLYDPPTKC
ncbi:MAG: integrase core domain-containing protein [Parcubacteria group bacterium]